MTKTKLTPAKTIDTQEPYNTLNLQDIYLSAFSSYGAKDADYDAIEFDSDNYAYEAY
jgi:hypothetical protein